MKRKLKKGPKNLIIFLSFCVVVFLSLYFLYSNGISKVNNDNTIVKFEVKEGSTYTSISSNLKSKNLIKSEFWYKIYVKLNKPTGLQAGTYSLRSNMNVKELVTVLSKGTIDSDGYTNITFKEGKNMRDFIKLVTENTNISEENILAKLSDNNYLDSLINKYWFIDESIKNKELYYSLEGYLYPDTYQVKKDGKLEDIITVMLNNLETKLEPYKDKIKNNKYNIHELLTLASIIELEAANSDDRNGVAGVFYNRLNGGWSLGSDVTAYYGAKINMSDRDLYIDEINASNPYNTRNAKMAGRLPLGPICNPSIESIEAAINPKNHNYYYFVADKNKKTYFTKTENEHILKVRELKQAGLWYEY